MILAATGMASRAISISYIAVTRWDAANQTKIFSKNPYAEDVKPHEVVFVDDSKKNIATADALGIKGVWVAPDEDWMPAVEKILEIHQNS